MLATSRLDGISADREKQSDCLGRPLGGERAGARLAKTLRPVDEPIGTNAGSRSFGRRPVIFDRDVSALDVTGFPQTLAERRLGSERAVLDVALREPITGTAAPAVILSAARLRVGRRLRDAIAQAPALRFDRFSQRYVEHRRPTEASFGQG